MKKLILLAAVLAFSQTSFARGRCETKATALVSQLEYAYANVEGLTSNDYDSPQIVTRLLSQTKTRDGGVEIFLVSARHIGGESDNWVDIYEVILAYTNVPDNCYVRNYRFKGTR